MSHLSRKEELELKKAKLAEMRDARLRRENAKNLGEPVTRYMSQPPAIKVDTESILTGLGIGPDGSLPPPAVSKSSNSLLKPLTKKSVKLELSEYKECSFAPTEDEKYSKDTQTAVEIHCDTPSLATDTWPETPSLPTGGMAKGMASLEWDDDILPGEDGDDSLTENGVPPLPTLYEAENHTHILGELDSSPVELTEEDKENLICSEAFRVFFSQASRIIEGALEEVEDERDIFFDYSGADKEDELSHGQQLLTEERVFFDTERTSGRTVSALDWSAIHPEHLLAAYSSIRPEYDIFDEPAMSQRQQAALWSMADGVCLLWNVKSKGTAQPDGVFTCQAPLTAAILSPLHPNIIVGGTYVGHLVLWDTRANRQTPVQRSSMATSVTSSGGEGGHCEAVIALSVAENGSLVSVSADGRLCTWSLDMLSQPTGASTELTYKQGAKTIVPTSVAFGPRQQILVGAQDGCVYTATGARQATSGESTSSSCVSSEQLDAHQAPVTSVSIPHCSTHDDAHDAAPPNPLFLSTSMDCSVKLWNSSKSTGPSPSPLVCFDDRTDYFADSDWSYSHPAVFATVDLGGHVDVWNLNNSSEVPTATIRLQDAMPNVCRFQRRTGGSSHVAVGDDTGRTRIIAINDKIGLPRPEERNMFDGLVERLTETAAERAQKSTSLFRDFNFSDL